MELKVLGSGSKGNSYLLCANDGETLIIECGLPFREIKQGLGFTLKGIVGCLITHRHKDHSFALHDVLKCGIRVLSIEDVFTSANVKNRAFCKVIKPMHGYIVGGYKIFVLTVAHDVPCVGFIIEHKQMGAMLFVTDTMMLEYKLPKLNHILIEANYSDAILEENISDGVVPEAMRERLMHSHMELDTCKGILIANNLSDVNEVVLIHLSGQNSNPVSFANYIQAATGKPVYVAKKGFELNLSKTPY